MQRLELELELEVHRRTTQPTDKVRQRPTEGDRGCLLTEGGWGGPRSLGGALGAHSLAIEI